MTPQLSFPRRRRYEEADAATPRPTGGLLELYYSIKQIAASWVTLRKRGARHHQE